MAQFGVGPELAAQCPPASLPDGWRYWSDVDGPVPDALAARAQAAANDETVALGATQSYPLPGVIALIRVEPHIWARDTSGNLVQGCFRVGGIYLPANTPVAVSPPSNPDSLSKTIGALTIASLAVGTLATIATWGKR